MPPRKNESLPKSYKTIDHTADIGIRVFGRDASELFIQAGTALFEQIVEIDHRASDQQHHLTVTGSDWPDLMVNWLRELLYLWTGRELLMVGLEIENIEAFSLTAKVDTASYNPDDHLILNEIKAVTYHGIDVSQGPSGWEATIIFDI